MIVLLLASVAFATGDPTVPDVTVLKPEAAEAESGEWWTTPTVVTGSVGVLALAVFGAIFGPRINRWLDAKKERRKAAQRIRTAVNEFKDKSKQAKKK